MTEHETINRRALDSVCRIWGDHRFRGSERWFVAGDYSGIGRTQEEADDPNRQVPGYAAEIGAMSLDAGELDSEIEEMLARVIADVTKHQAEQAAFEKSQADALAAWMSRAYVMARDSDAAGFEAAVKRLVAAVAEHGPGYFATHLAIGGPSPEPLEPAPDGR